jgi:hypothetical protein
MTTLCDHFLPLPSTRTKNERERVVDLAYLPFFDIKAALLHCFAAASIPGKDSFEISFLSRRKGTQLKTLFQTPEEHLARQMFQEAIANTPKEGVPQRLWHEEEQRAKRKVYKWEEYFLNRWTRQTSLLHFEDLVSSISRDYGIPPPVVKVTSRQQEISGGMRVFSSYSFPNNRISAHPLMLSPLTGVHETAHAILDHQMGGVNYMGHGPSFVRLVCNLYETYLGCPASLLKPQAIRMDIWGAQETDFPVHPNLAPATR